MKDEFDKVKEIIKSKGLPRNERRRKENQYAPDERRKFFKLVLDYINTNKGVLRGKLLAYFQYEYGLSPSLILNSLDVLSNMGFIEEIEEEYASSYYQKLNITEQGKEELK